MNVRHVIVDALVVTHTLLHSHSVSPPTGEMWEWNI